MRLILIALILMVFSSTLCVKIEDDFDEHLSALIDYENNTLEPWRQELEGQSSRETLPALRRVERQEGSEGFPMAASRARRRTPLIAHRINLSAAGRLGRGSYQSYTSNWDNSDEDEQDEALAEFEELNDSIFMFPASYLVPESLAHPFCLHKAGLWSNKVEETVNACNKAADKWKCFYMKMGRPSADKEFSMDHLTKWLHSGTSGPKSLVNKLSSAPKTCNEFWKRFLKEEKRRLFLAEIELEVEHRTADLKNSPRWRRNKEWDDEQWNEIFKIRRHKWQERLKRLEKTKRLQDLKGRQEILTPEEREEMMQLKARIGELGERERETVIGQNLEREDRVLMDEAMMLAQCIRQRVLEACDETILNAVRDS